MKNPRLEISCMEILDCSIGAIGNKRKQILEKMKNGELRPKCNIKKKDFICPNRCCLFCKRELNSSGYKCTLDSKNTADIRTIMKIQQYAKEHEEEFR